jgi:hypothetical protein
MELSHLKLFPPTIQPEKKHSYSYQEYFEPEEGTYISNTSISNASPLN